MKYITINLLLSILVATNLGISFTGVSHAISPNELKSINFKGLELLAPKTCNFDNINYNPLPGVTSSIICGSLSSHNYAMASYVAYGNRYNNFYRKYRVKSYFYFRKIEPVLKLVFEKNCDCKAYHSHDHLNYFGTRSGVIYTFEGGAYVNYQAIIPVSTNDFYFIDVMHPKKQNSDLDIILHSAK